MSEVNSVRRTLLAGMIATPAMGLLVVPAAASTSEWDAEVASVAHARGAHAAAVKAFGDAEGVWFRERRGGPDGKLRTGDTVEANTVGQAEQRATADAHNRALKSRVRYDELQEESRLALAALDDAETAVIMMPAPTMEAAIQKLELAMEWEFPDWGLSHIRDDLRRLTTGMAA